MGVKEKLDAAKQKASQTVDDFCRATKRWYYDHREDCQKAAAILGPAALIFAKNAYKDHRKAKEKREADCEFYDFRDHQWYGSKRPLTNREKLEMEEFNRNGVSKGEYLKRKRLLKK